MSAVPVRLVLSDVDGTLVTPDKQLTPATIDAVRALGDAGITFAVTSGRPPLGMKMLIEPLALTTPIAAFNGGVYVDESMHVLDHRALPAAAVGPVADLFLDAAIDVWIYRGAEWLVRDPDAPHVAREAATVGFRPEVVADLSAATDPDGPPVVKIVGVSDDHELLARIESTARDRFGHHVSAARSQDYYLDVTPPGADKGAVARYLSTRLDIPAEAIATIGDMPNDVLMFAHSGTSIAMGNADPEVQRSARHVTTANDAEGFATAMERFVLPGSRARHA